MFSLLVAWENYIKHSGPGLYTRRHPDPRHSSYVTPHLHFIPLHSTPLHSMLSLHFDTSNKTQLRTLTAPFPLFRPVSVRPSHLDLSSYSIHSTYTPLSLHAPHLLPHSSHLSSSIPNPLPSPLIFYTLSRTLPLHTTTNRPATTSQTRESSSRNSLSKSHLWPQLSHKTSFQGG